MLQNNYFTIIFLDPSLFQTYPARVTVTKEKKSHSRWEKGLPDFTEIFPSSSPSRTFFWLCMSNDVCIWPCTQENSPYWNDVNFIDPLGPELQMEDCRHSQQKWGMDCRHNDRFSVMKLYKITKTNIIAFNIPLWKKNILHERKYPLGCVKPLKILGYTWKWLT